jgi:opacity protein-like surface antigen
MRLPHVCLLLLLFLVPTGTVQGQAGSSSATKHGWQISLKPYLWMASLKGQTRTLPPLPASNADIKFGDLLKNLEGALMIAAELRKGDFGFFVDFSYVDVGANGRTPFGVLYSGIRFEQTSITTSLGLSWRAYESNRGHLDLLAGARIWSVHTTLTLRAGLLPATSRNQDRTWADALVGVKGRLGLGVDGLYAVGWADIGGFGIGGSRFAWHLFGGVQYEVKDWISVFVGYRHMAVDYRRNGFVYDINQTGPILGAVFRFGIGG